MKKNKFALAALAFFVFGTFFAAAKEAPKVNKVMPFTKGINLCGWLEPFYNEQDKVLSLTDAHVLRFGRQDFEDIKSLGVEIIRMPVHFQAYSSGAPDYKVADWVWEALDKAVKWCAELKMYIIIDYHNNCQGSSKTSPNIEKILLKIWPQIAERYKNSGEYVLYEVHNEPHLKSGNIAADVTKWGKIQGNVLKAIRAIDQSHTVIVGADNWNGLKELLKLPDYKDDNIIYNFHDYSPMLFTHQGTSWTDYKYVTGVPFPYSADKTPSVSKEAPEWLKAEVKNYPQTSSEAALVKPLDDAVAFANKRGAALMCDEWGVMMTYADNAERANWYRLKAKWMDERNIARISWAFREPFGLFKDPSYKPYEARFPEDLNVDILKALGFKVPSLAPRVRLSWLDVAKKKNDYSIYKDGFAENILSDDSWVDDGSGDEAKSSFFKKEASGGPRFIYIEKAKPYNYLNFDFCGACDFSPLANGGKFLEFEVRSKQKDLGLEVYFMPKENPAAGKAGLPWRGQTVVNGDKIPSDGNWHKVRIPLSDFKDVGTWSNRENKWINSEGLFSWKKVHNLVFSFGEKGVQDPVSIRNIVIK